MVSTTAVPEAGFIRTAPEWVVFGCADRRFALPLGQVQEIVRPRPFTRIPGCGAEVCGLVGFRGRILTAFDLGAALGLRPAAEYPDHRLLLIEWEDRVVAGVVEEVIAVARTYVEDEVDGDGWQILSPDAGQAAMADLHGERTALAVDATELIGRLLV